MSLSLDDLYSYPYRIWGEEPSERWLQLCNQLQTYESAPEGVSLLQGVTRKWELVSACQKSVRRGLLELSPWLVSELLQLGATEWAYSWRRICVIAAEDVGFGDPELMNFVIACSTLFRSSSGRDVLGKVWLFLIEHMCKAQKSRIFCQLSLIEERLRNSGMDKGSTDWERTVLEQLGTRPLGVEGALAKAKKTWALKNNWRAEGMLKYQATIDVVFEVQALYPDIHYEVLKGLPDFSYDTHTRSGRAVCTRLAHHRPIRDLLNEHRPAGGRTAAVGWGLFFAEGRRIQGGLEDARLNDLEAKAIAGQLGWTVAVWNAFVYLVHEAVSRGTVNEIRKEVLKSVPQQGRCEQQCLNLFG